MVQSIKGEALLRGVLYWQCNISASCLTSFLMMHRKQSYFWEGSSKIPKGKPVPKRSAGLWNMRTFSITKIRQASICLTEMSRLPRKFELGQSFMILFKISLCYVQIA